MSKAGAEGKPLLLFLKPHLISIKNTTFAP